MKDKSTLRYLTFPIELLRELYQDSDLTCVRMICSGIVHYAETKLHNGTIENRIIESAKYYNLTVPDEQFALEYSLKWDKSEKVVVTSINRDVLLSFYKNRYKSDFDLVVFAAYCAIRSIIGCKPFAQMTNSYLLSRMAGYSKNKCREGIEGLHPILSNHSTRHYINEIKYELCLYWGLKILDEPKRGFVASFRLDQDSLSDMNHLKSRKQLIKELKAKRREAKQKARNKYAIDQ